jgi:hypothetical protein
MDTHPSAASNSASSSGVMWSCSGNEVARETRDSCSGPDPATGASRCDEQRNGATMMRDSASKQPCHQVRAGLRRTLAHSQSCQALGVAQAAKYGLCQTHRTLTSRASSSVGRDTQDSVKEPGTNSGADGFNLVAMLTGSRVRRKERRSHKMMARNCFDNVAVGVRALLMMACCREGGLTRTFLARTLKPHHNFLSTAVSDRSRGFSQGALPKHVA